MSILPGGPRLKIVRFNPVRMMPSIKRVAVATSLASSRSTVSAQLAASRGHAATTNHHSVSREADDVTPIDDVITDLVEVGREIVVNTLERHSPQVLLKKAAEMNNRTAPITKNRAPRRARSNAAKISLPKSLRSRTVASMLYPSAKSSRDADTRLSEEQQHRLRQDQYYPDLSGSSATAMHQHQDLGAIDVGKMPAANSVKRMQFCRLCDRLFKSHESYVRHFLRDHPGVTREQDMYEDPWRCMYCGDWFDGPRRLSYHVKSYHKDALVVKDAVVDNRPTLAECKLCGAMLKSSLVKHTLKAHPEELGRRAREVVKDPRQCPLCGKLCSGEQGLRNHLYRTHGSSVARGLMKQGSIYMDLRNPESMPVGGTSSSALKRPAASSDPLLSNETNDLHHQPPMKIMSTTPLIMDNDFDSFQIAEETVVNDDDVLDDRNSQYRLIDIDDDVIDDEEDDEECSPSFCRVCRVDLMNTTHLASHNELNHKQVTCPLCVPQVVCEGLLGLDSHDDSSHGGAIRLQSGANLP